MSTPLGDRNFEVFMQAAGERQMLNFDEKRLQRACQILGAIGLRVVPEDVIRVNPDLMSAVLTLAKARMNSLQSVEQLACD